MAGAIPGVGFAIPGHRAVAREAELAAVGRRALEDDATHGLGEAGVGHPVQHHLGHSRLAARGFAAGFEIDRLGEAIEFTGAVERRHAMTDRQSRPRPRRPARRDIGRGVSGKRVMCSGQAQGGRIHAIHFAPQHGFRDAAAGRRGDPDGSVMVGGGLSHASNEVDRA